jgi:hypothetical protein
MMIEAHRFTQAGFSSLILAAAAEPMTVRALVPTFFGAFAAAGRVKREAHRCSKRL